MIMINCGDPGAPTSRPLRVIAIARPDHALQIPITVGDTLGLEWLSMTQGGPGGSGVRRTGSRRRHYYM